MCRSAAAASRLLRTSLRRWRPEKFWRENTRTILSPEITPTAASAMSSRTCCWCIGMLRTDCFYTSCEQAHTAICSELSAPPPFGGGFLRGSDGGACDKGLATYCASFEYARNFIKYSNYSLVINAWYVIIQNIPYCVFCGGVYF